MIKPTPRAIALFGMGIPLSLLIVVFNSAWWPAGLFYLGFAGLLTGMDAVIAFRRSGLLVDVGMPDILYVGDRDEMTIALTNRTRQSDVSIETEVELGGNLEPQPRSTVTVARSTSAEFSVALVPRSRGMAHIVRLWIRWSGPLGLIGRGMTHDLARRVPVVPNIRAVRAAAVRFSARDAFFGIKAQSQHGEGSEFEALREYAPGLDHRAIDWKHSARHKSLLCKEFRAERNHQIIVAVDTGQLMSEPLAGIPRLDHAINSGLLLSYTSALCGDRVGLFGFDTVERLFCQPVGGITGFLRIQRLSAQLEYRHEETNYTLGLTNLMGRLNRRSLVILITEFIDTVTAELMIENIERLARRHLVLFVSFKDDDLAGVQTKAPVSVDDVARATVADGFARERAVVLERLHRLGVQCLETDHTRLNTDLINRYLMIKRRDMI